MRSLAEICILTLVGGSVAFSQAGAVPAKWNGTWALGPQESAALNGSVVLSGTLEIQTTLGHMKITSDLVASEGGSSQETFELNLDGSETIFPEGPRLSFKRIDDLTFDVIASVNNKKFGNHLAKYDFVLSDDGSELTETITRTEREVVSDGENQSKGTLIGSSRSVLVFSKILFIPPAGRVFLKYIDGQR